ncbi:MAG TPA: WD40 repeat domain-containing protein, partial [Thermoanaerobaculia bacterium]|nr:WD40 repeat domain-containing protein [Thermoanaerobaculia bacterium]
MRSFVVVAALIASLPAAAGPEPVRPASVRVVAQTGAETSSISFSRDGRYVVTSANGFTGGSSRLWDAASGRLRQVFPGGVAAISPDGAVLATGGLRQRVRLWDTATGELRHDLGGDLISALAFTPDGSRVAVSSQMGGQGVRVWDVGTGRLRHQCGSETWATSLQVSPDGAFLLGAGSGGRLEVWDLGTCRSRHTLSAHPEWTEELAVSRDGSLVATAGREGGVRLWEPASGRLIRTLAGGEGKRTAVAVSADGRLVAAPGTPGRVTVWDRDGQVVRELASGGADRLHAVAVSPDGGHVIAAGRETFVWDAADGRLLHAMPGNIFAVGPDGLSLAVGASRGCMQIVDLASGEKRTTLCGRSEPAFGVAVTPDGRSLLASEWNVTHHWDLAAGGPPGRLGGTYSVNSAAAAGSVVVTAGEVWDRSAGKRLRRLERRATAFAVSPDGAWIATGGGDGTVQVSEAAGGRLRATLRGPASPVHRVAFSPDLSYVAVATEEGRLSLWSLDGELLHTFSLGGPPELGGL